MDHADQAKVIEKKCVKEFAGAFKYNEEAITALYQLFSGNENASSALVFFLKEYLREQQSPLATP